MPVRYVVLHHTGYGAAHYDLMIDVEGQDRLATWRLPHWPPVEGMAVERLPSHRRAYLEYEGPVSGGRGQVRRVAAGMARREGETIWFEGLGGWSFGEVARRT